MSSFDPTVSELSFDIADIDSGEQLIFRVLGQDGRLLETRVVSAGQFDTGDGLVMTLRFSSRAIASVVIVQKTTSGFGIDNLRFSRERIPFMAELGIATLGALSGLVWLGWRRTKRVS